jgi:hypothetical protein
VLYETHVVDVDVGLAGLRHQDRIVPEAKTVNAVWALRDGEEGFAVCAFNARDNKVLAVVQDGAGVEGRVDRHPLEQHRVGFAVKIVAPMNGRVRCCENGSAPSGRRFRCRP